MTNRMARVWLAAALGAGGLCLCGCATEDYVDKQIATVNGHVAAVDAKVDQVGGQVGQLSGRVDQVSAQLNTKIDGVARTAQEGSARANDAYKLAQGKFSYA